MNFKVIAESNNDFGDKIYKLHVTPAFMIYFGYIVESLEGWAFHTIIDKKESILHVEVIRDYINDFEVILHKMNELNIIL